MCEGLHVRSDPDLERWYLTDEADCGRCSQAGPFQLLRQTWLHGRFETLEVHLDSKEAEMISPLAGFSRRQV